MNIARISATLTASMVVVAGLASCGGNSSSSSATVTAQSTDVSIKFAARVGSQTLSCGETYSSIGNGVADTFLVNDFRMFISNVALVHEDATETALSLTQDGVWQSDSVALLDFENGCANGTSETNNQILGSVELDNLNDVKGICFTVGVPFELNHLDTATSASPLNTSGMFWAWQGGHKFIRIDGVGDPSNLAVGFNLHLGSTGCVSDGSTSAPTNECQYANTPRICLAEFDADTQTVGVQLDAMLQGTDISVNTASTPPGCMSGNFDPECISIIPRIGLDFTHDDGVNPAVVYPALEPQTTFVAF